MQKSFWFDEYFLKDQNNNGVSDIINNTHHNLYNF